MSALLERLLDASRTVESLKVDSDGRVTAVNVAYARHHGAPADHIVGQPLDALLAEHEAERVLAWCRGITGPPSDGAPVSFVSAQGEPYTLWCHVECAPDGALIVGEPDVEADAPATDELLRLNNEMATLARENVRRRREAEQAHAQLAEALEELRTSYWHLQKIQEVMPICMKCGKVKADHTEWTSVADYLRQNDIFLSHGYCPVCARAVELEFGLEDED